MTKTKLKIKLLSDFDPKWILKYAMDGDAGFDLYSSINYDLGSEISIIPTGICVEIPEGYHLEIRTRSGMATNGIMVVNSPGTIDSGYRGEIKVILANLTGETYSIKRGQRIAQAVLMHHETVDFEYVDELTQTSRSEGGFGHTG